MGDNHKYALHGVLDDATNRVLALWMCENECRYGYIACRRLVLQKYGIEIEDYTDRSPVFHNNAKEKDFTSIDEQLAGDTKKIPLWEALNKELGVKLSLANSPQAKGKIERMWNTMQGRLPFAIKKRGFCARDIEIVNEWLNDEFIKEYNSYFVRVPKIDVSVFKYIPRDVDIDNVLCVKESHLIYKDGTIKFRGLRLKIVGLKYWSTRMKGDLCINEKGLFFLHNGKRYELDIKGGELSDINVSQVLEEIISDTMYCDIHEHAA